MVESIKLLQDSLGILFWNEVAAAWQNDALEIGCDHRHRMSDSLTQSLLSADRDDRRLNLVLRERQRLASLPRPRQQGAASMTFSVLTNPGYKDTAVTPYGRNSTAISAVILSVAAFDTP